MPLLAENAAVRVGDGLSAWAVAVLVATRSEVELTCGVARLDECTGGMGGSAGVRTQAPRDASGQ